MLAAAPINGPVLLVGHSFGGLIAAAFALAEPQRVVGLVLVDAVSPAISRSRALRTGVAVNIAIGRVLSALAPLGAGRALFALRAMPLYPEQHLLRAEVSAGEYRRWVGLMCIGFAGNAVREIAAVLTGAAQFPKSVARFGGPVTVIHSRLLGKEWVRMQRDIEADYPGATRIPTGDLFHNIHLSHPDLIIDAVHSQLAIVEP